jgi:DNA primase
VAGREPLFAFAIRSVLSRYDLDTNEGRLAALDAAAPVVASIKDPGLRKTYVVDLDRWLGFMDEGFVIQRVQQVVGQAAGRGQQYGQQHGQGRQGQPARPGTSGRGGPGAPSQPGPARREPHDPVAGLEAEVLKFAVQRPALLGPEFDTLGPQMFTVPEHAALYGLVAAAGGTAAGGPGGREWVDRLLAQAAAEPASAHPGIDLPSIVTRFAVEALRADASGEERYGAAVLARLQETAVGRAVAQVKSRLQRLNPVEEPQEYKRLFGELVALEQQRRVLIDRAAGV